MVLLQEIRFALRQWRKSPAFVAAAVVTLGLGIGANATIFNWLNATILNPIPGVQSDGLHCFRWRSPEGRSSSYSWPTYLDIRAKNQTLAGLAAGRMTAFSFATSSTVTETKAERIFGMLVSADFFDVLALRPVLGRTFRPDEDRTPGAHPVAVISHALWQTRLGGDPAVVGKEVRLNTKAFTVVGIMPEGFQGSTLGLRHDVWVPVMMRGDILGGVSALEARGNRWLEAIGRLKPGVDVRQAEQELTALSAQLTREYDKTEKYPRAESAPIWRAAAGQVMAPLLSLLSAVVGVVLLIACANVGNLLMARAAGRRREIAIRLALGVSRGRLIRQLLVENAMLSAAGAALALALVPFTAGLLTALAPPTDLAINLQAQPDWKVLLFTLAVSALATLVFGLAPAIRASRPDVVVALKEEATASTTRSWTRNALVVAQVALSLVLLVGAGLLLRSLQRASSADPGFDPRNVLLAGVDLKPNGYTDETGPEFVRRAIERISALPGVALVSTVRRVPLTLGGSSSTSFTAEGYTPAKDEELMAFLNYVGPDYFRTLGTPLTAGRDFQVSDNAQAQPVVVINETLAQRYYAGRDPVGRRFTVGRKNYTVIGVAKDSKFQALDEPPAPFFWLTTLQEHTSETNFLVRTQGDPLAVAKAVEGEIRSLDRNMAVYGVRALEDAVSAAYITQKMGGWLLGFFGALALLLAAVGLYGVLAYSVAQRSREVGIRMALGASRADVLRMVLGHGLRLTGLGLAIGLVLAFGVTRFMQKLLFGVSPTDALTLLGVSGLLALVALTAAYLPARRATRIDPIVAIRYE